MTWPRHQLAPGGLATDGGCSDVVYARPFSRALITRRPDSDPSCHFRPVLSLVLAASTRKPTPACPPAQRQQLTSLPGQASKMAPTVSDQLFPEARKGVSG